MIKKILWIIVIIVLAGAIYVAYLWFKPHRDIVGEAAEYEVRSSEMLEQFQSDEQTANTLYLDKVVLVKGEIEEMDAVHIKLSGGIYCNGDFSSAKFKTGEVVSMKGRVVGFDELFGEVRMDNCVVN